MQLLEDFIKNNKEPREIKRATAVKMLLCGYKHEEIIPILGVSSGFISTYKKAFFKLGLEGLKLRHKGSKSFLDERGYPALLDITRGGPVGALVFAKNAVAGDIWTPSGRFQLDHMTVIGSHIRRLYPSPQPRLCAANPMYDRHARLFGDVGQEIFANLKVGMIAYCEEALQVDGSWGTITPATAWFNRGVVLRKLTRPEEALTSFERAVNLNSNYSVALAEQCGTLIDLQRYEEATKACDLAIKTNENWGKGKEAIAWNNKALALFNLGKMSEAVAAYEHALAIDPNDVTSWDNQGMLLHKMGQYEKALVSYNRATEINPKYSLAFAHRCETLNRLQRYEESLSDCDRAVALGENLGNETLAYLWHQRTNALLGLQKYETALDAAERAIALKLNYAEAWSNKGVILWNLKKYEDALAATKRAVDINPKYVQGWYNYGRVLSSLQDYQQAIVAYDQALNANMESVDNLIIASIWAIKGASLWRIRKYQLALNSTNEAIKINPESFEGWYNKGVILLDLARYDEALVAYYKANDLNDRNASVWAGIGMALAKSGKPQAALKAFESALNINPNYTVAQRARDVLLSKL